MTSMKRESMESLAEGSVQDYDRGGQQGGLGGPTPPSVPGSIITHGHIFGMKGDVAGGLQYVDESTLAYPCGHSVVLLNLETREQKLVPGTGKGGITAMALAPNGRYLALAESAREDEGIAAGVNLFDVATQRRRKMMMSPELGSRKIVSTTFSLDGRMCAVQGGSPSWNLLVWSAEKSPKILHSIRTSAPSAGGEEAMPVAQISFSPRTTGSLLLCVTGDRVLRFFRVGDGQCKPMSLNIKSELQSYTCHAWTSPDVVVVGARTGGLLVIDGYESKGIIPAPAQVEGGVSSLVAYSKGIVAGFDDGSVCIYEACEDGRLAFKCVKVFHLSAAMPGSPPPRPLTFSVSPTEDYMAIITDELQLLSFNLSNTDILKEDGANNFDQICTSFHSCSRAPPSLSEEDEKRWRAAGGGSARVNSVDVCVWKPLVASVGADQTLRLWNHVDRRVELLKRLPEEAKSVALHPSGMYLSLAYQERVRLYSVVIDDIREVKDWPSKTCRSQAFSRGGQYLAIATGSQVQIINTFTAGTVAVLKGHQGHVVNITWQDTEQHIMTATSEGQLIVWDVLSGKRIPGNFSIRSGLTCAGAFPDFSRQYCAGSDGLVRELNVLQGSSNVTSTVNIGVPLTGMAVAEKVSIVLACTAELGQPGAICWFPTDRDGQESEIVSSLLCLEGPATCMALSHCGTILILGGECGEVAIFDVNDEQKSREQRMKERETKEYTEETLIAASELAARNQQLTNLASKVEELKLSSEYQLRLKDMSYKEKISDVTDKLSVDLSADGKRYEQLMEERRLMTLEYEGKTTKLAHDHAVSLERLSGVHAQKVAAEVSRYDALADETTELECNRDDESRSLVEKHAAELRELTDEYDHKVEAEQDRQRELTAQKQTLISRFKHLRTAIESDADVEAEKLRASYMAKLATERSATETLKGENAAMKKKYTTLNKQVVEQREEMKVLQDRQGGLRDSIKGLEKDISGHKKEIREREDTILDKEQRITDLVKKNQELEKFKFVLDYKIKELRRQIEPRETEIADMRSQIEEMDLELEQYHKSNSALDLMIGELRLKMDGMQREMDSQRAGIAICSEAEHQFQREIHAAAQHINDTPKLKTAIVQLYKRRVLEERGAVRRVHGGSSAKSSSSSGAGENDTQKEYNRQREHLERSVGALKHSIAKDMRIYASDRSRLHRENVILTKEINDLRREAKILALQQMTVDRAMSDAGSKGTPMSSASPLLQPPEPKRPSSSKTRPQLAGSASSPASPLPQQQHQRLKDMMGEQIWREIALQEGKIKSLEQQVEMLQGQELTS